MKLLDPLIGHARQARFWAHIGDRSYPYSVYDFTEPRERDGLEQLLAGDVGYHLGQLVFLRRCLGAWDDGWMEEPAIENLFADLPTALSEELVTVLAENQHVRIERIVSTGHASPEGFWYDQEEAEWVVVLKGEAKLLFEDEDEPITMRPGDHAVIPAHRKHRVEWTTPDQPTVWLAVFFGDASWGGT